ncbi:MULTISPECIES: hypothetical protein [Streptomyces]|uniref:hypothetical protein n=1 Tax=Streptomyces TaxID=1883 RepID=UPI000A6CA9EA|nr:MULTISPECIES: hypothetical protein [Streptomyces]
MAQSVGYLVAAAGPLLLGILRDSTGSWTLPLVVLVALCTAKAAARYGAGRNRLVRCSAR